MQSQSPPPSPFEGLRNAFLAGVALVLPLVLTGWLLWTLVNFIDNNVVPLLPGPIKPLADTIPGVGVVFAVAGLTVVGALAGNLFGRVIVRWVDTFIGNLPLVRSIYGGAKQVFEQVAAPKSTSFKRAVLVEFPKPGVWIIGFVTNEDGAEIIGGGGEKLLAVFVPHAPLPTSGMLFYVHPDAVRPLTVKPEEALKRVLSLGIIRDVTVEDAKAGK